MLTEETANSELWQTPVLKRCQKPMPKMCCCNEMTQHYLPIFNFLKLTLR